MPGETLFAYWFGLCAGLVAIGMGWADAPSSPSEALVAVVGVTIGVGLVQGLLLGLRRLRR